MLRGMGVRVPPPALYKVKAPPYWMGLFFTSLKSNYKVNIVKEDKDGLNALLKVNIAKEDYLPEVEQSIKKLSKQVDIKGFRKGNVPVSVVKKRFGDKVLAEELNKMLETQIGTYLKENEINILGNPIPKVDENPQDINLKNPIDLEFVYELGLSPEFEISALEDNTEVEKYKIKVEDKQIEEELDRIKLQFGETENPESGLKAGDEMEVKLEELDADGNVKESGVVNESAHLAFDDVKSDKLKKELADLKLNDTVDVNIYEDFDKDQKEINSAYLALEGDAPEGMNSKFRMTLNRIDRKIPAELNQEIFDKLFGEGEVKSVDELKDKIKGEIDKAFEQGTISRLNQDIFKLLIEKTEISLPNEFLKKWIKLSNEQPISDEQLEKEYDNFAQNLKWSLISNKIAKAQDIKVTEEEVREKAKAMITQQFGMNASMLGEEQLNSFAESLVLKNKEQTQKIYEQLNEEKLFDYIRNQVKTKEKEISLEEFKKLVE